MPSDESAPSWFASAIATLPEHRSIQVEGLRIAYRVWGDEEVEHEPPLLLKLALPRPIRASQSADSRQPPIFATDDPAGLERLRAAIQ